MKRQLLVGSALALLMATAPALADTSTIATPDRSPATAGAVLLAQDEPASQDALLPKKHRKKPADAQAAPEAPGEAAPVDQPQPKKQRKPVAEAAPAPAPQAEPAQQAEQLKPKKQRKPAAEVAAPAPEPQAEPSQQAEQLKPKKQRKPAVEKAAPAPGPQAEPAQQAEQVKPKKQKPVIDEAVPAPEPQTEPAQQAEQLKPKKQQKPAAEEAAPAPEPQTEPAQQAEQLKPKKQQKPAAEEAAPAPEPQTEPAQQAEQVKPKKGPKAKGAEEPGQQVEQVEPGQKKPVPGSEENVQTGEQAGAPQPKPQIQPNAPAQEEVPGTMTAEQPTAKPENKAAGTVEPEAPATATAEDKATGTAAALPKNAAPVLDSAKEVKTAKEAKTPPDQTKTATVVVKPRKPKGPPAPPPADDRAAQAEVRPDKVETVTAERGRRVSEAPAPGQLAVSRPQGVDILKEIGGRVVVQIANEIAVQSSDRPRMARGARDVYYEDLPDGRTRETVVRQDGTQVVTIRNEYGDIIRRSRITEDGREYVLAYVDDRDYQRVNDWRDPGDDLLPMQLDVPMDQYVLDADNVEDTDTYYRFLERPPVERVERLYSVDEVKRSARIRDKIPRIELDTVTFEFGAATIEESEVPKLQGVAEAMARLLKKNPAETFLIEGHTDAVGSDVANLALSDQRAEAVAQALTNVFGIAPENLATQGYGERYLKVAVDGAERLNRRVVIRRITPLVAPIASAQ